MRITGQLIVGYDRVSTTETFRAVDPATASSLDPPFAAATARDIDRACELAHAAMDEYRAVDLERRAAFLEAAADGLMQLGDDLLERAQRESGLPRPRLEGERARTVGQLKLFAQLVRSGDWLRLRVDPALPEREPIPRPDLRLRMIPVGPVVVFGASNFPLAFSAAGGDVAAALAAACPVIVKGHPAHPGTSELAAFAISQAARECGMPAGTYSHLSGPAIELGAALVRDPRIKAIAFTGSRTAGLALARIAQSRPEPIPVFAEMSSINPVILLPGALKARAEAMATEFVGSVTLGAGQFCTNPGLLLGIEGADLERFATAASEALSTVAAGQMLTPGICANYQRGLQRLRSHAQVTALASGAAGSEGSRATAALFQVRAQDFQKDRTLEEELFGPSSLLVTCRDAQQLMATLSQLEGQLTVTLQLTDADHDLASQLLPLLERRAGRILVNGWPTGVEVAPAMVHGGPFPATSDVRSTSVGTLAIERFLRPVCYQNFPQPLLPQELRGGAHRYQALVDGRHEKF